MPITYRINKTDFPLSDMEVTQHTNLLSKKLYHRSDEHIKHGKRHLPILSFG